MDPVEIGPITRRMYKGEESGKPPAVVREWGEAITGPGQFVLHWAGVVRVAGGGTGWDCLSTHLADDPDEDNALTAEPPANVERLLSPLAHEGRVRIMQALLDGPLGASELAKATGFQGGGLYHHLKELLHAEYIMQAEGRYRLTRIGCQLLLTVCCLARHVIVDRGEKGLGVEDAWRDQGR